MTTLREIIEGFEFDKAQYDDPGGYADEKYYIKCEAKSDVLADVIYTLKKFEREIESAELDRFVQGKDRE